MMFICTYFLHLSLHLVHPLFPLFEFLVDISQCFLLFFQLLDLSVQLLSVLFQAPSLLFQLLPLRRNLGVVLRRSGLQLLVCIVQVQLDKTTKLS